MEPPRVGERRRDLGEERTQRLIINKQRGGKKQMAANSEPAEGGSAYLRG